MAKPDSHISGGTKRGENRRGKENRTESRETERPDRLSTCSSQIFGVRNQS